MIVFSLARVTGNPLDVCSRWRLGQRNMSGWRNIGGLDKPLYTQYLVFMGKALRGDFGTS